MATKLPYTEANALDSEPVSEAWFIGNVLRFINFFIPKQVNDSDELIRYRMLCGLLLVYIALLASLDVFFVILSIITFTKQTIGLVILTSLGLAHLGILVFCRAGGRFLACVHSMVFILQLAISTGVVLSGGPLESGVMFLAVIPTITAFFLGGRRAGFTWFYLSLMTYGLIIFLNLNGIAYWETQAPINRTINVVLTWLIGFFATVGLVFVYETMHERLKAERDIEHQRYVHLARYDSLTNIPNRYMFNEHLQRAVSRSERNDLGLVLMYIDLDGFKSINDKLGHSAGDSVLKEVTTRLSTCVRKSDLLARIGGDEFALIMEGVYTESEIAGVADKIVAIVSPPLKNLPGTPAVTASVGIALYPDHALNDDELISKADRAMYYSKQRKNCWSLFASTMSQV